MEPESKSVISESVASPRSVSVRQYPYTRVTSTRDWSRVNHQFWDRVRHGSEPNLTLSGGIASAAAKRVAGWALETMPIIISENKDLAWTLNSWLRRNRSKVLKAYEESRIIGDAFIIINPDSSVSLQPVWLAEPLVDEDTYSKIVGWSFVQRYTRPVIGNAIGKTIEDRYIYDKVMRFVDGQLVETFKHPSGMLPVIHIANNADLDEVFGNPDAAPMLDLLYEINEVLRAGLTGNKLQGRPTPVFERLGDADAVGEFMNANSINEEFPDSTGAIKTEPSFVFDADQAVALSGDAQFKYVSPQPFIGETERLLNILIEYFAQNIQTPMFVLGMAVSSSKAATESQMPVFVRFIKTQRLAAEEWLRPMLEVVKAMAVGDGDADWEDEFDFVWRELSLRDERLVLDTVNAAYGAGLISKTTAIQNLPVVSVDDVEGEIERTQSEQDSFEQRFERDIRQSATPLSNSSYEERALDANDNERLEVYKSAELLLSEAQEGYIMNKDAREEAERALEWRRKYKRGGTSIGVKRANDIKRGAKLSLDTINRMYSFFKRHEVDKKAKGFSPGEEGYPSPGRIAWGLWGGDPAFRQVKDILGKD